jgi:hypothetical protein
MVETKTPPWGLHWWLKAALVEYVHGEPLESREAGPRMVLDVVK